jgi:prevent-host-death family protein
MERLNVARDIQPLSAFRKQASALIDEIQRSRRPLVLTRNGRSAVVVLDVGEFERMVERIELLEDVQTAREQARRGETVPQQEALAYVSDRVGSDRIGASSEAEGNADGA